MPLFSHSAKRPLLALGIVLVAFSAWAAVDWYSAMPRSVLTEARYVGRNVCARCHQEELREWTGSHHDRAMELATEETVQGDFNDVEFSRFGVKTRMFRRDGKYMVNAEGPDGKHRDYEVKWTFGVEPLQQYMVELGDDSGNGDSGNGDSGNGRVQVLRVSWDTEKKKWFYVAPVDARDERLMPGDPLHWTGVGQNWNTMCAECHSTDLHKNFDFATDSYHTEYFEIDVSCEACHGPGSVHVELAESNALFWDRNVRYGLTNPLKSPASSLPANTREAFDARPSDERRQVETCAPCHSRRAAIHDQYRPGKSHAGDSFFDYFNPSLIQPGLYHADGQILDEVYVYGSFVQSRMYRENVRCSDCHNPHSLELKFAGNALCTQCHQPGKYDGPAHHHHTGEKAEQAGATLCVNCHMPTRTYMEIDDRRDHSLRVPRPDLSVELGTPNACNDCHVAKGEDAQWAAERVVEWYGAASKNNGRPDDPHYAPALAAARSGGPEAEELIRKLLRRMTTPDIIRATAIDSLANVGTARSDPWILDALEHDSPLVRAAAARALRPPPTDIGGARGDLEASRELLRLREEYVDHLAPLLQDPIRMVRLAAAFRLAPVASEIAETPFADAFTAAIEEYRQGQAASLDRVETHMNLAQLDWNLGNQQAAINSLRAAIKTAPYRTDPRTMLIERLVATGGDPDEVKRLRKEEAELLLRDQKIFPGSPILHYRRGMLLYLLGKEEEAREEITKACEFGPNDYGNWLALALINQKQQRWEEAVDALQRMEQLQPGSPDVRGIYRQIRAAIEARDGESASEEQTEND